MRVRPISNNILITPVEDKITSGGLYVPESVEDQQYKAKVVALGTGRFDFETGTFMPHQVAEGDLILHKRWGVSNLKIDGKLHFVISEEDVLAIIDEE